MVKIAKKTVVFWFIVCLVACFFACYVFFPADVSDNGSRADNAREQLEQAGKHNHSAFERSETIEAQRERIAEAVTGSLERARANEKRAAGIEDGLGELQAVSDESKSILAGVRARNEKQDENN